MILGPIEFHRVASALARRRIPVLPTLLDYAIRLVFACVLPHTAQIGSNVKLGYGGLGVVIHKSARIEDDVEIGQGVTIGGNAKDLGVPTIRKGAYIGAGAKVLGPIEIGSGAIIGANAVVLESISENSTAVGVPARIVRRGVGADRVIRHRRDINRHP